MKKLIIIMCLAIVVSACTDENSSEIEKTLEPNVQRSNSAIRGSESQNSKSTNGRSASSLPNPCYVFYCEDNGGVIIGDRLSYWGYTIINGNLNDAELFVYKTGFNTPGPVTEFQAEPYQTRLGYLKNNKSFWIDRINTGQSISMYNNVDQFQLESNRIAVRVGGKLLVKEGSTSSAWVTVASSGVSDFVLEGNRIAIIQNGTLKIKEGGLSSGWVTFENNIQGVDLSGNRIVWLTNGGILKGKDGSLYAATSTLYSNVNAFQIDGDRIGQISGGTFRIKEGALYNAWTTFEHNISSFKLHKDRIGWLTNSGTLKAKDGALWASTTSLSSGVVDFDLKFNQVILLTSSSQVKRMLGNLSGNISGGWNTGTTSASTSTVSCGLD